jgi:hypothetical protein
MIFPFATQVALRNAAQVMLNQRNEAVQCGAVTVPPTSEKFGDVFCLGLHASIRLQALPGIITKKVTNRGVSGQETSLPGNEGMEPRPDDRQGVQ